MDFPGHQLRTRRLEMNLSSEAAATECAIPVSMIDALEGGAIDRLPASCYTIGFIHSYCRLLQLEPEFYVCALKQARLESGGPHAAARPNVITRLMRRLPIPRVPGLSSELHAWLIITALLAMGWIGYSALVRPQADPSETQAHAASVIELRLPDAELQR